MTFIQLYDVVLKGTKFDLVDANNELIDQFDGEYFEFENMSEYSNCDVLEIIPNWRSRSLEVSIDY